METFVHRKERRFLLVDQDTDDQFIDDFGRSRYDIKMAKCHRIKAAWIYCFYHLHSSFHGNFSNNYTTKCGTGQTVSRRPEYQMEPESHG